MSRDDTSDFRPRTGRIRDRGGPTARRSQSFVDQVMKAAAKANGGPLTHAQITGGKRRGAASGKGRCSRIGRGQAVADRLKRQAAERSPGHRQRRVVVKARIVRHEPGAGPPARICATSNGTGRPVTASAVSSMAPSAITRTAAPSSSAAKATGIPFASSSRRRMATACQTCAASPAT